MAGTVEAYADLAGSQRDALWAVYHHDGATPQAIAVALSTNYGTINNAIQRLDDEGLVEKDRHPFDARKRVVSCTDRGKQVLADRQKWERGSPEVNDE